MRFGPLEIGLILLLVLIIFGAGKLPEVGAALGRGIKEFKKAQSGEDEEARAKSAKASGEDEEARAKSAKANGEDEEAGAKSTKVSGET